MINLIYLINIFFVVIVVVMFGIVGIVVIVIIDVDEMIVCSYYILMECQCFKINFIILKVNAVNFQVCSNI